MSSLSNSDISISKKALPSSRMPVSVSRTIKFYHKAAEGSTSILLTSLNMPSEFTGQSQITADDISNAHLYLNRKNFTLVSLSKGLLHQGLDYTVSDSITINLMGSGYTNGADFDEIFIGSVACVPLSDVTVTSAKSVVRTYTPITGDTTVVLSRNYNVNMHPNDNIGIIKVYRNGILQQRNTGNSSTVKDRDYYEVSAAGNSVGTAITFNTALTGTDRITVDFGVNGVSDIDSIGNIEAIAGSISRLSDAVSAINGVPASTYISTSPSDIERLAFGDYVINALKKSVPIGTVRASLLTLEQFQAESWGVWVLANGQNVAGTEFATLTNRTTVPDMRATALRMKDNGRGLNPDGDLALGAYQGDMYASHNHSQNPHSHTITSSGPVSISGGGSGNMARDVFVNGTMSTNTATATNNASGGNETRMKNTTVNFFIKVGY